MRLSNEDKKAFVHDYLEKLKNIYINENDSLPYYTSFIWGTGYKDNGHIKKEAKYAKKIDNNKKVIKVTNKSTLNNNENCILVHLGSIYNNLIMIDFDNINDTVCLYKNIILSNDKYNKTLITKTPNKGYHNFYLCTENQAKKLGEINFYEYNCPKKNVTGEDLFMGMHVDIKYDT